ncbi:sigma factor-like helix-turn-helix DNA-binding protein [Micromonospora sp. BRA006-A]|nr:sigma factor-like helix-turn-helix DNA-binding protein [Micromonospora sp. BRA006-A]
MLILRDVLGWPARDVAELLGDSVNSVNSALQRARAGMWEHLPAQRQDWTGDETDTRTRELVRRFTDAAVAKTSARSPPCCATTCAARCRPPRGCRSAATRW